jgi:hypothetical protein
MEEIAPGIFHWTNLHPDINSRVSSYYVAPAGVVIDPIEPEDGWAFFDELDMPPQQAVLTIGLHWRHSDRFAERYGTVIRAPEPGLHRYEGTHRDPEPYAVGEELAPGVVARELGCIAPDETVLEIDHGGGAYSFADGLIAPQGVLGFVPDYLMDDPDETRAALRDRLRGLLERDFRFEHLLFAHGEPIAGHGRSALSDFVNKPVGEDDFGQTA